MPSPLDRPAWIDLARFIVVGGVGFVIDGGLMVLLLNRGLDIFPTRMISFTAAVSATYLLNRTWTFSKSKRADKRAEYALYFATQFIGAGINLGTFFVAVYLVPALRGVPLVPFTMGAALALIFNFSASRYLIFR